MDEGSDDGKRREHIKLPFWRTWGKDVHARQARGWSPREERQSTVSGPLESVGGKSRQIEGERRVAFSELDAQTLTAWRCTDIDREKEHWRDSNELEFNGALTRYGD